jgi:hypothetical protein
VKVRMGGACHGSVSRWAADVVGDVASSSPGARLGEDRDGK